MFLHTDRTSCVSLCAHCVLCPRWDALRRVWLCYIYSPHQPMHWEDPKAFPSLCWAAPALSISPPVPQSPLQHHVHVPCTAWVERKIHFSWPAGAAPPSEAQGAARSHCCLVCSQESSGTSSAEFLPSWSALHLYWCLVLVLFHPRCRTGASLCLHKVPAGSLQPAKVPLSCSSPTFCINHSFHFASPANLLRVRSAPSLNHCCRGCFTFTLVYQVWWSGQCHFLQTTSTRHKSWV